MNSLIKLVDICKTFKMDGISIKAVCHVNLEIKKGEFVSIIGPSGSGKSTLMHILGCLDRPTSGKQYFNNEDISSLNQEKLAAIRNKKIGFIFQNFNLLARTTAIANAQMPLIYSDIPAPKRNKLAKEKLAMLGLADRIYHFPNQLSGGQQQRVAIARALINNPDLILADEPTGNLDSKSGREIMEIFHQLHRQGHTIILVTHDLNLAKEAKRQVILKDGKIIKDTN